MRLYEHQTARCRNCGRQTVRYALKEEPTGWKVYCECASEDCDAEWNVGWISRIDAGSLDDVYQTAEELVKSTP